MSSVGINGLGAKRFRVGMSDSIEKWMNILLVLVFSWDLLTINKTFIVIDKYKEMSTLTHLIPVYFPTF